MRRYWIAIGVLILLTPLGLLAEGTAWGEWGAEDLTGMLGFVPQGIAQAGEWWQSLFPDYSVKGVGEGRSAEGIGYIISAIIGSVLVYVVMLVYMKLVARTETKS